MSSAIEPVYLAVPSDMVDPEDGSSHYYSKCGGSPVFPVAALNPNGLNFGALSSDSQLFAKEFRSFLVCGTCKEKLSFVSQVFAPVTAAQLTVKKSTSKPFASSREPSSISERLLMLFGCTTPRCGRTSNSWRAFRVQIDPPPNSKSTPGDTGSEAEPGLSRRDTSSSQAHEAAAGKEKGKETSPAQQLQLVTVAQKSLGYDVNADFLSAGDSADTGFDGFDSKKDNTAFKVIEKNAMVASKNRSPPAPLPSAPSTSGGWGSNADFGFGGDGFGTDGFGTDGFGTDGGFGGFNGYDAVPDEAFTVGAGVSAEAEPSLCSVDGPRPLSTPAQAAGAGAGALTDWSSLVNQLEAAQEALAEKQRNAPSGKEKAGKSPAAVVEEEESTQGSYPSVDVAAGAPLPAFYVAEESEEKLLSDSKGTAEKKRGALSSEDRVRTLLKEYAAEDEEIASILQQSRELADHRKRQRRGQTCSSSSSSSDEDDDDDEDDGEDRATNDAAAEDDDDPEGEEGVEGSSSLGRPGGDERGGGSGATATAGKRKGKGRRKEGGGGGSGAGSAAVEDQLEGLGWAQERYEVDKVRGMVPSAVKFWKLLSLVQEQCFMYQYNGRVRWPLRNKPRPSCCPRCGRTRAFEMQAMPALMSAILSCSGYLDGATIEAYKEAINAAANWDFATVAVFTCEGSCSLPLKGDTQEGLGGSGISNSNCSGDREGKQQEDCLNVGVLTKEDGTRLFIAEEEVFIVSEDECHVKK